MSFSQGAIAENDHSVQSDYQCRTFCSNWLLTAILKKVPCEQLPMFAANMFAFDSKAPECAHIRPHGGNIH